MLDRPVWNALSTRQARHAQGGPLAVRLAPDIGVFAASAGRTPGHLDALAALAPPGGRIWLVEDEGFPLPPGLHAVSAAACHQMTLATLTPSANQIVAEPLTGADASAMLALATLTVPGPFFIRTHTLGRFIGLKENGTLIAMAGERMQPPGFTEVSGVCTHPDRRGRGYAGALMRIVAERILARGETPFLHVYASNKAAIVLYEKLGFRLRREITMTVLARP